MEHGFRRLAVEVHLSTWIRRVLSVGLGLAVVFGLWLGIEAARRAVFFYQTGLEPESSVLRQATKEIVTTLVKPYYDSRLLATTHLPIYDLELRPGRLEEWHGILRRVTARGRSTTDDQIYLPASFRFGDEVWAVDIRGRGTLAGHYREEKPSFRVKFPSDRYFRGSRVVNFIIPYEQTRIVVDTTLNAVAEQYGLVTYPRGFAVVRLNGEVLGVYQEMEHFRKEMAVKQRRSEGFFVSGLGEGKGGAENERHAGFRKALAALVACLESCSSEQASDLVSRFFDAEKLATYSALTTWFASDHAWGADNLILFFDPARGRFEPVPWDVGVHPLYWKPGADKTPELVFETNVDLGALFLEQAAFRRRRNEILWDLLHRQRSFVQDESRRQFAELRPLLDYDTEYSRKRTRRFYDGFQRTIEKNAVFLLDLLRDCQLGIEGSPTGLRLVNHGVSTLDLEQVTLFDGNGRQLVIPVDHRISGRFRTLEEKLEIGHPIAFVPARIEVAGRNHLSGERIEAQAVTWEWVGAGAVPASPGGDSEVMDLAKGISRETRQGSDTFTFTGEVRLAETLVLPPGASAVFTPGLHLSLDPGVLLVVRGDLEAVGTKERPILVSAAFPDRPFAALAVIGRSDRRVMVRCAFFHWSGGQEGDFDGIHLSGSFSIYDGDLEMRSSRLLGAVGEDGLNVKYGRVSIEDSLFQNTASDAVDLDFCVGKLEGNVVRQTAGDGFDFSGSTLLVRNNTFQGCADKGLSIGEQSVVVLRDNEISDGTTGVAVKDRSIAELDGNHLRGLQVGVSIYQKKPVFGSGFAEIRPQEIEEVASDWLLDPGATVYRSPPQSVANFHESGR